MANLRAHFLGLVFCHTPPANFAMPSTGTSPPSAAGSAVLHAFVDPSLPLKSQLANALSASALATPGQARALAREARVEEVSRLPKELAAKAQQIDAAASVCRNLPGAIARLSVAMTRAEVGASKLKGPLAQAFQHQQQQEQPQARDS